MSTLSVATDVRLVKAALLYADHVTLASGVAAMLTAASKLLDASDTVRARRLMDVASVLLDPDQQRIMALLRQRSVRRKVRGYAAFEAGLQVQVREVERVVGEMRSQSGIDKLRPAIDAGLLEIDDLGLDPTALIQDSILLASGKTTSGVMREAGVGALVGRFGAAATLGSGTYPLFDEGASSIVAAMIREGHIKDPAVRPAGHAGLAGHFVGQVPAFPDAEIGEIVDVRRGLDKPLARFRGAVAEMASSLESAPWDPGFTEEADDLYRIQVVPALADLEQNARDSGALALLKDAALSRDPWAAAGSVLVIALTGASTIPDWAALAFSVGAPTAAVVAGAAKVAKEKLERRRIADNNRFLFLYQANQDLRQ